jgi:hypothetical protein
MYFGAGGKEKKVLAE